MAEAINGHFSQLVTVTVMIQTDKSAALRGDFSHNIKFGKISKQVYLLWPSSSAIVN